MTSPDFVFSGPVFFTVGPVAFLIPSMCSPSIFSLESFLMQRFERFLVLVYNVWCGAAGVNEARLHLFISGTTSLESIPSTQVSDTTIGLLTASSLTGAAGNPRFQGMGLTQG